MSQKGRTNADHVLVLALACGATVENAAKQADISETTVYRRLKDRAFRKRLHDVRADMVERVAGTLTAAGMESVRTLLDLQKDMHPPAVRLGAAKAVLELGVKLREAAELTERVSALEERMQAGSKS